MNTQEMTTQEKIQQVLKATNTDWTVSKKKLQVAGTGIIADASGVVPSRPVDGNEYIGTVKGRYTFMQNERLLELLIEAAGIFINPDNEITGETYNGGAIVKYNIELDPVTIGKGGEVKRWVTAINSHNGGFRAGFGWMNRVMVCSNGMYANKKDLQRFHHSKSIDDKMRIYSVSMNETLHQEQQVVEFYKVLAEKEAKQRDIDSLIVDLMYPSDAEKEISTRRQKKIDDLMASIETSFEEQGTTLWGLFNGVTRYTNHVLESKNDAHLFDGAGSELNHKALEHFKLIV